MSIPKKTKPALTKRQVAAYLKAHPDFFKGQDELLTQMSIPHVRGSAISLVERQLLVLRERNTEMSQRLNHLLDVARENDRLFEDRKSVV